MGRCRGTERDRRNVVRFNVACFVWTASWLLVKASITSEYVQNQILATVLIGVTTLLGGVMIFFYRHYLKLADELQRTIQLEALALSFGVTLVGCVTYSLLVDGGSLEAVDLTFVIMLMVVSFMLGVVIGNRRYL